MLDHRAKRNQMVKVIMYDEEYQRLRRMAERLDLSIDDCINIIIGEYFERYH